MQQTTTMICFWLFILCLSSCQDDNTRKLVAAMDRNTAAIEAAKAASR